MEFEDQPTKMSDVLTRYFNYNFLIHFVPIPTSNQILLYGFLRYYQD